MGFWGYVHFISSTIGAIHAQKLSDMNPDKLINIDRFLGSQGCNGWAFLFGWLVFIASVWLAYRWLKNKKISDLKT
ncbi:hypothetical protein A3F65_01230 [Candidatus Saccharibacteria bacterium RIFCSPHIGHO2_12_FULL_47_16b]|nr:MAG: hypothetical protein A3F65_01230 [Candidatus Saccharibacteria bacterium RIFCSPHIGHO2_12_FULL_47_16b]OGL39904.1 MAG: hypothetical protein A3J32_02730 [Candidatus Saccharibacteria bacterium RIFCSPLOWO2_02_FULL_46_7]